MTAAAAAWRSVPLTSHHPGMALAAASRRDLWPLVVLVPLPPGGCRLAHLRAHCLPRGLLSPVSPSSSAPWLRKDRAVWCLYSSVAAAAHGAQSALGEKALGEKAWQRSTAS